MSHEQPKTHFFRPVHILWILLAVIALRAGFYSLSDGFSLSKIKNTFPVTEEWQLPAPTAKEQKRIANICGQKFHYLWQRLSGVRFFERRWPVCAQVF